MVKIMVEIILKHRFTMVKPKVFAAFSKQACIFVLRVYYFFEQIGTTIE